MSLGGHRSKQSFGGVHKVCAGDGPQDITWWAQWHHPTSAANRGGYKFDLAGSKRATQLTGHARTAVKDTTLFMHAGVALYIEPHGSCIIMKNTFLKQGSPDFFLQMPDTSCNT
jgi:hypothetical protein